MKKGSAVALLSALVLIIITVVIIVFAFYLGDGTFAADKPGEAHSSYGPQYVLKEYSGKIAVFKYNDSKPLEVFNVSVDTMSDYDKLALHSGICAETDHDLWLLVEDYTS